jgi:lysophospholipase L1-like esterase
MFKKSSASQREPSQIILLGLPFIIYLHPAVALLTAKSTVPVFFGLYSANLLLLNVFTVLIYGAFVFGLVINSHSIQFCAVFCLAILTLVAANNSVFNVAALDVICQVARTFAGLALIAVALFAGKRERIWLSKISLIIGAILAFSAITDFGFALVSRFLPTDDVTRVYRQYRLTYDLAKVIDQDIVLVGDSLVWGSGVRTEQRFGDILEHLLNAEGKRSRVYSLGITGADVKGYIQQIQDVPGTSKVKQVVLCFYANDMPARVNLQETLQQVAESIGRRSVTLHGIADLLQLWMTPTAEAYANVLLTHYVEDDGTFAVRWNQLERELREFFQLAAARSINRPMIMMLPILIDFDRAAFDDPMRRVSNLAKHVGFEVVDTMPAFRAKGEKAERYRAAPNDLHLNEHGNRIVADVLFRAIADAP